MTSITRSKRSPLSLTEVLRYSLHPASRATVRRYYAKWREESGLPVACDMPDCVFHQATPIWKDKPLPLILDHSNGNKLDNRPKNLRYLCPNCNSQLPTRVGRIEVEFKRPGKESTHWLPKTASATSISSRSRARSVSRPSLLLSRLQAPSR